MLGLAGISHAGYQHCRTWSRSPEWEVGWCYPANKTFQGHRNPLFTLFGLVSTFQLSSTFVSWLHQVTNMMRLHFPHIKFYRCWSNPNTICWHEFTWCKWHFAVLISVWSSQAHAHHKIKYLQGWDVGLSDLSIAWHMGLDSHMWLQKANAACSVRLNSNAERSH